MLSVFHGWKKSVALIGAVVAFLGVIAWIAPFVPSGIDWTTVFRPATLAALHGRSPYSVPGYFYPPWAVLPLIPFALLPESVGRIYLVVVALGVFGYIAYKLGAGKVGIAALLISPLVLHEVLNGNIDWLVAAGVVLPPWIGLFLVVIKPQISVAVVGFWMFSAWKNGGLQGVIRTFAPVTVAYGLSLIIFGLWPITASRTLDFWWNTSLWPISIPIGLALFVTSIRKNDLRYAMGASPCLSPYVLFHSWVIALLAVVSSTPETIAAVVGLWILIIIRAAGG
jgi:hypothetical protein